MKIKYIVFFVFFIFIIAGITFSNYVYANENQGSGIPAIFFFDDYCLTNYYGLERKFYPPQQVKDFLFIDDHELAGTFEYVTILYDQEKSIYRMWYLMHTKKKGVKALLYSESSDGLKWHRADVPQNNDRLTYLIHNAVFSGEKTVEQGTVCFDEYAEEPNQKFKLPYLDKRTDVRDSSKSIPYMRMATSPDGIHWNIEEKITWHPHHSDTENNIFFNTYSGKYQIICRALNLDRRIAMVESKDLIHWSNPRIIIHPSHLDPVGMQFYGMPVFRYEKMYLGLLWKFQTGISGKHTHRRDGYLEPELTYSYDGLTWYRTFKTFIERPARGFHGGGGIYGESIVVDHDGNIRIYSRGNLTEHQKWGGGTALILHKLRRDGFVGLESFGYEGYLKTKPFKLEDGAVSFNIQAPYGSVWVQISNRLGEAYPGFSFDDCERWTGDDVFYMPNWNGKQNLDALVGKTIRFEIKIEQGVIYAIRAKVKPFHGSKPQDHY